MPKYKTHEKITNANSTDTDVNNKSKKFTIVMAQHRRWIEKMYHYLREQADQL